MSAFIDSDKITADANQFITNNIVLILPFNARFVAAQHFPFANLFVLPELAPASRALDGKHLSVCGHFKANTPKASGLVTTRENPAFFKRLTTPCVTREPDLLSGLPI